MADKEYIERGAAKGKFSDHLPIGRSIRDTLDEVPAADVVEVRRGKWTAKMYTAHCSCGKSYQTAKYECSACKRIADMQPYGLNFCPNCGADMRGNNDDSRTEN